jgi:hypothetical protein
MQLTTRESAILAYALNTLALAGDPVILATTAEISDLSARVITATIKENK